MACSIHPKYFNKFLAVTGILCLIAIFWGTMKYADNQQSRFAKGLNDGTEVRGMAFSRLGEGDTVRISDYEGSPVILDFWSTWAGRSAGAHAKLNELQQNHPELIIIAASVKDSEEYIREYLREHDYNFIFVDGTDAYQDLLVPGVPAQLVFDRQGTLKHIFVGFRAESQFDEILTDARE